MRNIVTVIDEVLAVIPKNPLTSHIRVGLNSIKGSVGYNPPEGISNLWYQGSDLFWKSFGGLDPADLTGWERTVVDIWMGKNLNKGEQ